ncbi:aspartyl protease family protein [Pedobacter panaciterrae]|uniref:Aspartyl protease family protein n=1 Tax=Pedobacter panaciterrae TaxID=363849 RepID=A0ABU8NP62_9SPHI|nr:aspartyl protease family protein [Pedobacter panaciterrae]NQX55576.1 aspartyl protease family protein [Pedobacter panaciterrae]
MNSLMRAVNFFFLKVILISIIIGICSAYALKAQQFSFHGSRTKGAVNFTLIRNLIIIPLYINNKGPYNFILDTGVGPLVITDTTIVKDLNLKDLRPIKITGLGKGIEIDAFLSNELSAKVGKASIDYIPTAILKTDILGLSNFMGIRIYGLLGYYFFNSFTVEINYSSKRVIFSLPGTKKKIKGDIVPLQIINNKPYINVELDTKELGIINAKVVVDNGASHAISLETLNEKPFPVPANSIPANLGIGLSGPISGNVGRVPKIRIGNFVLKDVISSYPIYDDVAAKTFILNRNGNLGADILSRFNVTFDYANEIMYLKQNQSFKRPFEHDMSGIEVYVEEDPNKRYFISRIEPNSPAQLAGIHEGDEIISINFSSAKTLNLNDITKTLRSGDGRGIFLSINRNGELLIKLIKLKKRI